MDTVTTYQQIVQDVLQPYTEIEYAYVDAHNKLVCDEAGDHFIVLSMGWETKPKRRIHGCLIHIDIIDGKVWIQRDGTEDGVADELEDAGIPKSDIVLGFHEAHLRQYTGYAA
ncbi:MAG: XisI protein [bacterium]|nr:XisI protein [bacterium]